MIRVVVDPDKLAGDEGEWWSGWKTRAGVALDVLLNDVKLGKDSKEWTFNDQVWKALNRKLLEGPFYGKCAYCESRIQDLCDNPPADHYRPKKTPTLRTATRRSDPVMCASGPHSGYYWLAYEWQNLLPSCSQCNTNGKGNGFPVRRRHVLSHDQRNVAELNQAEEPLLLHPYFDEPRNHLKFGDRGVVGAVDGSEHGVESIRYYQLDREGLQTSRSEEQERAWLKIESLVKNEGLSSFDLSLWKSGPNQYCAAVFDYIRPRLAKLIEEEEEKAARLLEQVQKRQETAAQLKALHGVTLSPQLLTPTSENIPPGTSAEEEGA